MSRVSHTLSLFIIDPVEGDMVFHKDGLATSVLQVKCKQVA